MIVTSLRGMNAADRKYTIYVGHNAAKFRLERSLPLANPYERVTATAETQEQYRRWLWAQIKGGNQVVIEALYSINHDTVLSCWCPQGHKYCHAHVIVRAAQWLQAQEEASEPEHDHRYYDEMVADREASLCRWD